MDAVSPRTRPPLRSLMPHLWPKGEPGMRMRVVVSLACLVVAKLANVGVPLLYKQAIDALGGGGVTPLAIPLGLILAYGGARVGALVFGELRDAVFARVAQRAVRRVGLQIFRHLHALSLRFHLERQTGGLSRSIERGIKGIENLLGLALFDLLPTLFETAIVTVVLWSLFDWRFAVATLGTVALYVWYTLVITEWRTKFRQLMNEVDSEANTKAIDSLLNYETVKYFGNEEHEALRFDEALKRYERAAVKSQVSLSLLNIGQAFIISAGLTVVMALAGMGIVAHRMTIGDFVLVNTYLLQLYLPLNYFGYVYREIKQSDRHGAHVRAAVG